MKTTGTIQADTGLWQEPNTEATNESGFSGLPAGYRYGDGTFNYFGYYGIWCSSSEYNTSFAWFRILGYDGGNAVSYYDYKSYGFSLRCLRD
jgi:uncharacterized protein (TIGR02145 family)